MDETLKSWATISEDLTKVFKFSSLLGTVIGGLIVLIYCYQIRYFPSGVTVGDALFFIWVILIFSFSYSVFFGVILGAAAGLIAIIRRPFNWMLSKSDPAEHNPRLPHHKGNELYIAAIGVVCNAVLLIALPKDHWAKIYIAVAIVGILYALLHWTPQNKKTRSEENQFIQGSQERTFISQILMLLMFLSPLIFGGFFGSLITSSMAHIGINIGRASISVDSKTEQTIKTVLDENGVPYKAQTGCTEQCAFYNVYIPFTGIGKNTLVIFGDETKSLRIPIETSKILIFYE